MRTASAERAPQAHDNYPLFAASDVTANAGREAATKSIAGRFDCSRRQALGRCHRARAFAGVTMTLLGDAPYRRAARGLGRASWIVDAIEEHNPSRPVPGLSMAYILRVT